MTTDDKIRITHERDGVMILYLEGEKAAQYERESASWIPLKSGVRVTDGPAGIEVELQH